MDRLMESEQNCAAQNLPTFGELDPSLPEGVDEELSSGLGADEFALPGPEAGQPTDDCVPSVGGILDLLPPPPAPPDSRPLSEVILEMRDEERW